MYVFEPGGSTRFLTVVGIAADELALMKETTAAHVLGGAAATSPRLITDAGR